MYGIEELNGSGPEAAAFSLNNGGDVAGFANTDASAPALEAAAIWFSNGATYFMSTAPTPWQTQPISSALYDINDGQISVGWRSLGSSSNAAHAVILAVEVQFDLST